MGKIVDVSGRLKLIDGFRKGKNARDQQQKGHAQSCTKTHRQIVQEHQRLSSGGGGACFTRLQERTSQPKRRTSLSYFAPNEEKEDDRRRCRSLAKRVAGSACPSTCPSA